MTETTQAPVRTVAIRWSLFRNLVLLVVLVVGAVLLTTLVTARQHAETVSRSLIERTLDHSHSAVDDFFAPVVSSLRMARRWTELGLVDVEDPAAFNRLFIPVMREAPQISAINVGDDAGRGLALLRLGEVWRNRRVDPPAWGPGLEFAEWSDAQTPVRSWRIDEPSDAERYDPRTRDWFRAARESGATKESGTIHWTRPYAFFTTGEPGITAAIDLETPDGEPIVLAIDVLLEDLSEFTRQLEVSPAGLAMLVTATGQVMGLPGDARFELPEARRAALLAHVDALDVPLLSDAIAARRRIGGSDPPTLRFESGDAGYWGGARDFVLGYDQTLKMVVIVPEEDLLGAIERQRLFFGGIALGALGVASVMALLLARRYAIPLRQLVGRSDRVRELDLQPDAPIRTRIRELSQLAQAQEQMRAALDSFVRYVPADVVRELLQRGEAARIGGHRQELTILFTDITGFTGIAETMSPEALTAHMAEYFEALLAIIRADGYGTVDKLVGDAIVAFWGAPIADGDHAPHAVEAVLRCVERLASLNAKWQSEGLPALPTRFGLASGPVIVGNVGSPSRLSYTALGDAVNVASRVEGLNRFYGTTALATGPVRALTGDRFCWRQVDAVRARGRREPVELLEPLGLAGEVPEQRLAFARSYEEALALYRARRFGAALERLESLARAAPEDLSVRRLAERARHFDAAPPPKSWDGVTDHEIK